MATETVETRTKDRVLVDAVYTSPVDEEELKTRRVLGYVGLVVLVLLLLAIIF